MSRSQVEALGRLRDQFEEGRYEEAEAGAIALAAAARRGRRRRSRAVVWSARVVATTAAVAHGRGSGVPAELDALIEELEQTEGSDRALLLLARVIRAAVLVRRERYTEAEAEAQDVLRATTRIAHLTKVWRIELAALGTMAEALCGQRRYKEAEAIAQGNLYRTEGPMAAALHCLLVRSLNGQERYEEALSEARRLPPHSARAGSGSAGIVTAMALDGLGRRAEAEVTARQAVADCEQFLHPEHPRIQEARTLLARITGEAPRS
ncbi:hypothetical protein [Streptomyces sp. NPDC059909]|uniref:hypothetical protein n=1 Tax=Streptomyces sp. NPDC059909 TaxID=3346998 RepID=UPI00364E9876